MGDCFGAAVHPFTQYSFTVIDEDLVSRGTA
jgi:hypothetical protein